MTNLLELWTGKGNTLYTSSLSLGNELIRPSCVVWTSFSFSCRIKRERTWSHNWKFGAKPGNLRNRSGKKKMGCCLNRSSASFFWRLDRNNQCWLTSTVRSAVCVYHSRICCWLYWQRVTHEECRINSKTPGHCWTTTRTSCQSTTKSYKEIKWLFSETGRYNQRTSQ